MAQSEIDVTKPSNWILLPPGNKMICRHPLEAVPEGARLATAAELLAANLGNPFPWGSFPDPSRASRLWRDGRVGYGGLVHSRWFMTTEGRFGGAPNVPQSLPGSLRCCLLLDGGGCVGGGYLQSNEGYAVVREIGPACAENAVMYRQVQLHAAEHVVADGGAIIVSPIGENNRVWVGFCGRCQICPSPELISFRQLRKAVPNYDFQLWPEWTDWQL